MRRSISLGKIKGIEIEINISWFIIFGLTAYMLASSYFPQYYPQWSTAMMWISSIVIALLLFTSVLIHELSHSLVSIGMGIQVKRISLFIFGGIAQIEEEPNDPLKELKIALAGPAMSVLIFVILSLLSNIFSHFQTPEYFLVILTYVANVNLVLAVFNMVPAFPLDGGRVLRALLWHFKGSMQNATKIASSLGNLFGFALISLGIFLMLTGYFFNGIWFIFLGWFINQASQSSYQSTIMSDIFNKIHISEFMTAKVIIVDYYISLMELTDNYFFKYKYASFPVRKDEEIIGLISLDNMKKVDRAEWSQTTVGRITTPLSENLIVSPNDSVSAAMKKLFGNGLGRVLVMDQGNLIGIVSKTDILNYIRIYGQLGQ